MHAIKIYFFVTGMLLASVTAAQNYQAINGSAYAGGLAVGNNPAAIIHVPYAWDITPLAIQLKQSSNAYIFEKFSLLSGASTTTISPDNGIKSRFAFANQNIRLLNTRIRMNSKSAIAFGANLRSYVFASSNTTNYQDTVYSLADFLKINLDKQPLSFESAGSAWTEFYFSYARTIIDDGYKILNAGATLKYNRSLAGGYAKGDGITYTAFTNPDNRTGYLLTGGNAQFGYSSNIDLIDSNQTGAQNRTAFLKNSRPSFGADIGIEYIILSMSDENDEEQDEYAYDTKIGISLLDLGSTSFQYSSRSRFVTAGKDGINDTLLENKFKELTGIDDFNDSLASIANSSQRISGDFVIYQPTRLVVNIDKRFTENIFVNAELTLPVISLAAKNALHIKDMNLVAITPRWENRHFGAYLPITMNIRKQLWVGGAFRAGPVLLGLHNFANLFTKYSMQNGGLYLALTIRPGQKSGRQKEGHDRPDKKHRQQVSCPDF